jgi:hypothetical protein
MRCVPIDLKHRTRGREVAAAVLSAKVDLGDGVPWLTARPALLAGLARFLLLLICQAGAVTGLVGTQVSCALTPAFLAQVRISGPIAEILLRGRLA